MKLLEKNIIKTPKKLIKQFLYYTFSILLFLTISFGGCYAYFTAKVESIGDSTSGTLSIDYFDITGITSTTNLQIVNTRADAVSGVVCPGDVLQINGKVTNTGNIDCYALVKLSYIKIVDSTETVEFSQWYTLNGVEVNLNSTLGYYDVDATEMSATGASKTITLSNISYTIDPEYTSAMSNTNFKLKLEIHAIQKTALESSTDYGSTAKIATNLIIG